MVGVSPSELLTCNFVHMYHDVNSQAKFRSGLILSLATRVTKAENTNSAITSEWLDRLQIFIMVHLMRIHDIIPEFLI
jgi:hypothetical protein